LTKYGVLADSFYRSAILSATRIISSFSCESIPGWQEHCPAPMGTGWQFAVASFGDVNHKFVLIYNDRLSGAVKEYALHQLTFAVRLLKLLCIENVILLSTATSITSTIQNGDVLSFRDHFPLTGTNPLFGVNDERWGRRFPDMANAYTPDLVKSLKDSAAKTKVAVKDVIACHVNNALLNSPHEGVYASALGAQVLVNGIIPEVVVSRHLAVNCAAICIVDQSTTMDAGVVRAGADVCAAAATGVVSVIADLLV